MSSSRIKAFARWRHVQPCDREHFATISGVGEFKLEKYGPVFIDEIRKESGILSG